MCSGTSYYYEIVWRFAIAPPSYLLGYFAIGIAIEVVYLKIIDSVLRIDYKLLNQVSFLVWS